MLTTNNPLPLLKSSPRDSCTIALAFPHHGDEYVLTVLYSQYPCRAMHRLAHAPGAGAV